MSPSPSALWSNIPAPARSRRAARYMGEDRAVPLSSLRDVDRTATSALYERVTAFQRALDASDDPAEAGRALDDDTVVELARTIGCAEYDGAGARQALHDVRGGALSSLTLLAYRARAKPGSVPVRWLRVLAADHLKVMRNAVLGLDDAQRTADMTMRPHPIERLVETLERVASDHAGVRVECRYRGAISTSCMEMGTLDRAVLNVANNAVRHAASDPVRAWLLPATGDAQPDLRAVVANAIEASHARALEARFQGDLSRLFVERFSTTGSGEGMHVCADLVAAAYGLARAEEAVSEGLVGARIVAGEFVAWLHWPAVA